MHISAKNSRRFFGDVSKDAVGSRSNNIDGKNEEGSALLSVHFSYEEEYVGSENREPTAPGTF